MRLRIGIGLSTLIEGVEQFVAVAAISLSFSAAGTGTNFNPATLGGGTTLVLDLWADKVAGNDGDAIASLTDQSGSGNTGTNTNSPTLKLGILGTKLRPVIRYNGTTQHCSVDSVASVASGTDNDWTLIICGKLRAVGAGAQMIAAWSRSSSSTPFLAFAQETTKYETDHRDDASSRTLTQRQTSDTNAHVFVIRYTGTAMTIQVDGTNGASDPFADDKGAMTVDLFKIAAWALSGTVNTWAQLDLNRCLLYSSNLSDGDIAAAKNGIASHVGITVS